MYQLQVIAVQFQIRRSSCSCKRRGRAAVMELWDPALWTSVLFVAVHFVTAAGVWLCRRRRVRQAAAALNGILSLSSCLSISLSNSASSKLVSCLCPSSSSSSSCGLPGSDQCYLQCSGAKRIAERTPHGAVDRRHSGFLRKGKVSCTCEDKVLRKLPCAIHGLLTCDCVSNLQLGKTKERTP